MSAPLPPLDQMDGRRGGALLYPMLESDDFVAQESSVQRICMRSFVSRVLNPPGRVVVNARDDVPSVPAKLDLGQAAEQSPGLSLASVAKKELPMTQLRERTDEWLRDAHATEAQAGTLLRHTAGRKADYPDFSRRLRDQADLCDEHARTIDRCLNARGSQTSLVKDVAGQISALGQSLSGAIVGDEVVKAALATSTFAQMQCASGRILVTVAEEEGDQVSAKARQAITDANSRFAADLDDMLPALTVEYLALETGRTSDSTTDHTSQAAAQLSKLRSR